MRSQPKIDNVMQEVSGVGSLDNPVGFFAAHIKVTTGKPPRLTPWSFEGHEYLRAILCDPAAEIGIEKAAQLGVSTLAIGRGLGEADAGYKVSYFLPTQRKMKTFVQERFDPIISADEYLTARITERKIVPGRRRKGKLPADNVSFKQMGDGSIIFSGMQILDEVKSHPLDSIILDEVSELPIDIADWAEDRLLHSMLKRRLKLGQPDVPEIGIDETFQESDQKFWMFRCGKCRKDVILELAFPECLLSVEGGGAARKSRMASEIEPARQSLGDGGWRIVCPYCQSRLAAESARWVAKYPGREISGYHLSQLYGPHITPAEIAKKWLKAQKRPSAMANFYISILGLPYAGDRQPLPDALLNKYCGDWDIAPKPFVAMPQGVAYAGIDQGDILHVIIRRRFSDGISRTVWAGETPDWAMAQKWLTDHGVAAFVVDAMPYKTSAKALCRAMKCGVICYSNAKATHYGIEDGDTEPVHTVNVNRTEMLDALVDEITAGHFWLPKRSLPATQEVIEHLKKLVKDKREDGSYAYKRLVKNHYGMAAAMSLVAEGAVEALGMGPSRPLGEVSTHCIGKTIAPRRW